MPQFEQQKPAAPRLQTIPPKKSLSKMLEGKLVSIIGNKLVMTCAEGKEHSHTLAEDVKLSLEGTACRAEDLLAGHKVRLTVRKPNRKVALASAGAKAVTAAP